MSGKAQGWAWDQVVAVPADKFVLLAYADHADHWGGNIFPSVGKIAEKTGLSRRQVQYATRRLEDAGMLVAVEACAGRTRTWRLGGFPPPVQRVHPKGRTTCTPQSDSPQSVEKPLSPKGTGASVAPLSQGGAQAAPPNLGGGAQVARGGARGAQGGAQAAPEPISNTHITNPSPVGGRSDQTRARGDEKSHSELARLHRLFAELQHHLHHDDFQDLDRLDPRIDGKVVTLHPSTTADAEIAGLLCPAVSRAATDVLGPAYTVELAAPADHVESLEAAVQVTGAKRQGGEHVQVA